VRWLYHVVRAEDAPAPEGQGGAASYAPASLAREGFIHASYRDAVAESARLYFRAEDRAIVLQIDPRRLPCPVKEEATPRGPMPHVFGPIPLEAVRARVELASIDAAPDKVQHTRIAFVAFRGMTLLDLVGPLDAVSRIRSMGFDETLSCEVVAATPERIVSDAWQMKVEAERVRPALDAFDMVVVAGGVPARALVDDADVVAWLRAFSPNRTIASVCTGSLLLGAAGRLEGKRATTHRSAKDLLARWGATYVDARVVDEGAVVTAAGVTCGIDLGIHLVRRIEGDAVAGKIAAQMHVDGNVGRAAF
jgi:cyclohexyl-isocyanide hydratase